MEFAEITRGSKDEAVFGVLLTLSRKLHNDAGESAQQYHCISEKYIKDGIHNVLAFGRLMGLCLMCSHTDGICQQTEEDANDLQKSINMRG